MSAWPLATASKRVWTVTRTQLIFKSLRFSWRAIESTTRLQRSMVNPVISFCSSVYENGMASVRYAMFTVLLSAIFFSRPSRARASEAAEKSASNAMAMRITVDFPFYGRQTGYISVAPARRAPRGGDPSSAARPTSRRRDQYGPVVVDVGARGAGDHQVAERRKNPVAV